jgi:alpha-N-arabinofuranosidase
MWTRHNSSVNERGRRALVLLALFALSLCPPCAAAQAVRRASIAVDARRVENPVSPLLYGQFVEFMFEGVKGGLDAELLRDRSFEEPPNAIGLPRYWERYPDDRDDDFALNFAWDERAAYPPKRTLKVDTGERERPEHSLRVEAGEGVIPRHGFYQPRVPVRAGAEYRGYLWMKTDGYAGRVTVALESDVSLGDVYASADISNVAGDWRKYEFTLRPTRADALARLCVLFYGRGRVWADQISLVPADAAPGGVRRDVFERVKALRPAFIRWPGGNVAQDYRWLWGVGPRDERFIWTNLSWKNEPEPSDFGTDEYVAFARAAGAEPSITVNVEGRGATAEEAAAWVEYCNGAATTRYGAMRAANGHPAPYGVKLWEVGNEIWGDWVRAHSDAKTYARNFVAYAKAMRAVDPTIKLIAVGDNDLDWDRTVLHEAGEGIDYLAVHHYYGTAEMGGDDANLLAHPLAYARFYERLGGLIKEAARGRDIKLAINEWGLSLPVAREHSMEAALYGARLMNVFERAGGLVALSAVSDLVNGWPGGIVQAGRHALFVTPTYLVNQLYAEHRGDERLATAVTGPTFDTSKEGRGVPALDAVASRTADGQKLFIKAVNTDAAAPLSTEVTVEGFEPSPRAEMQLVTAASLRDSNDFAHPDAVSIRSVPVRAGRSFGVMLPAHSVAVITLEVARRGEGGAR